MTEQEKRNAIRRYFAGPRWFLGRILCPSDILIGDAGFDRSREEALRSATGKAFEKWGVEDIDLVAEPVCLFAPGFGLSRTPAVRKGCDGVIRFNPIRFCVLAFGEYHLFSYFGVLDMVEGGVRGEQISECLYRNLVHIAIRPGSLAVTHQGVVHQFHDMETLILTTTGGTFITVPLRSQGLASILGGEMPLTGASEAVRLLRVMMRQKKLVVPADPFRPLVSGVLNEQGAAESELISPSPSRNSA